MRQALHILKKDFRGLAYEIAITLGITLLFAVMIARPSSWGQSVMMQLPTFLLPFTWWNLIARAVYAEALPGDRQFWLTRPYRRGSLLAAKALLIMICVNLPALLAEIVIVTAYGADISTLWRSLLWYQVLLTAGFLVPAAALSTLTTRLSQLALAAIPAVVVVAFAYSHPWFELMWIRTYALLVPITVTGIVILVWQYTQRRTAEARLFAVVAVVLITCVVAMLPWRAAFWMQSRFAKKTFDESAIQVERGHVQGLRYGPVGAEEKLWLTIPLTLASVPPGTSAEPAGWEAIFEAPDGTSWTDRQLPWYHAFNDAQSSALHTNMDSALFRKLGDLAVNVHGTLYFTVLTTPTTTQLVFRAEPKTIPGAGTCRFIAPGNGQDGVLCDSLFRSPSRLVSIQRYPGYGQPSAEDLSSSYGLSSYSPFPAEVGISPVYTTRFFTGDGNFGEVHTREPLAFVKRSFEIKGLRLSNFQRVR